MIFRTLLAFIFSVQLMASSSHKEASIDKNAKVFGEDFKIESLQTITSLIAAGKIDTKSQIRGNVQKVCKSAGCWMDVVSGKDTAKVKFYDYGFFVPVSLQNKEVALYGKLKKKTLSVATQKHYLEDEGASKEEIEKINSPKDTYQFIATGVKLIK